MTTRDRCEACHTFTSTILCLACQARFCLECETVHVAFAHPSVPLTRGRSRDDAEPDRLAL